MGVTWVEDKINRREVSLGQELQGKTGKAGERGMGYRTNSP